LQTLSDASVYLDPHLIRQATERYVERGNAFGLVSHQGFRSLRISPPLAVPLGPLSRLAQVEEPGMRSGEAGGRGGLGVMSEPVRLSGSSPSARTASPANAKLLQKGHDTEVPVSMLRALEASLRAFETHRQLILDRKKRR
jgi:hypothetical protein